MKRSDFMRKEGSSNSLKDFLVALVISFLMSLSSFFSLLISLPLLIFSTKHTKKETTLLFGVSTLIVILRSAYLLWGSEYFFFQMLLSLYIPLSLLVAGMVWINTRREGVEKRLVLSLLPSLFLVAVCALLLVTDRALFESIYNGYKDAFVPLIEELISALNLDFDSSVFFDLIITFTAISLFPLVVGANCVTLFIFESTLHSREGDWSEKLRSIEFNQNLIWLLIISLSLFLISRFVSVNVVVFISSMSLTMALLILYGVQGFSVLYTLLSRVMPNLKSISLFFMLLFIGLFIPGLNIIVLLGLPILGILENFFDLKKRKEK